MNDSSGGRRMALVRASLLFQLKLLADGLRDFLLVPVSLAATVIGLVRSGENPEEEFERVLDVGRATERWINLFGSHEPIGDTGEAGNIDQLVTRAERTLREQVRSGNMSESAGAALERTLDALHRRARESGAKTGEHEAPPARDDEAQ